MNEADRPTHQTQEVVDDGVVRMQTVSRATSNEYSFSRRPT
jgi:hypothetical protein